MNEATPRRVGRPSEQVLSRSRIITTAIALLDERGSAGFGMRDVARELGVRPSALYNHVANKDDVFRGIREDVASRISTASLDTSPWDAALVDWARSYRDAFAAHPTTIALLAVTPYDPESDAFPSYDRVIAMLGDAGWGRVDALNRLVALESFILGSALDAAAAPDMLHPGDRTDTPEFTAAYREREERVHASGGNPAELAFEAGLSVFIAGLRAEQRARSTH